MRKQKQKRSPIHQNSSVPFHLWYLLRSVNVSPMTFFMSPPSLLSCLLPMSRLIPQRLFPSLISDGFSRLTWESYSVQGFKSEVSSLNLSLHPPWFCFIALSPLLSEPSAPRGWGSCPSSRLGGSVKPSRLGGPPLVPIRCHPFSSPSLYSRAPRPHSRPISWSGIFF